MCTCDPSTQEAEAGGLPQITDKLELTKLFFHSTHLYSWEFFLTSLNRWTFCVLTSCPNSHMLLGPESELRGHLLSETYVTIDRLEPRILS